MWWAATAHSRMWKTLRRLCAKSTMAAAVILAREHGASRREFCPKANHRVFLCRPAHSVIVCGSQAMQGCVQRRRRRVCAHPAGDCSGQVFGSTGRLHSHWRLQKQHSGQTRLCLSQGSQCWQPQPATEACCTQGRCRPEHAHSTRELMRIAEFYDRA